MVQTSRSTNFLKSQFFFFNCVFTRNVNSTRIITIVQVTNRYFRMHFKLFFIRAPTTRFFFNLNTRFKVKSKTCLNNVINKFKILIISKRRRISLTILSKLSMFRHHREMQEVVSELTDKYPDVYVRNLAQKHMEDKQVSQSNERKSLRECVRF